MLNCAYFAEILGQHVAGNLRAGGSMGFASFDLTMFSHGYDFNVPKNLAEKADIWLRTTFGPPRSVNGSRQTYGPEEVNEIDVDWSPNHECQIHIRIGVESEAQLFIEDICALGDLLGFEFYSSELQAVAPCIAEELVRMVTHSRMWLAFWSELSPNDAPLDGIEAEYGPVSSEVLSASDRMRGLTKYVVRS